MSATIVDCFIVFAWDAVERFVVAVNYAPNQAQCHVRLPFDALGGKTFRLTDQLTGAAYDWSGDDLQGRGLYLDMPPWGVSVFQLASDS